MNHDRITHLDDFEQIEGEALPWRSYLATHPKGVDWIGVGILYAILFFIPEMPDHNQNNQDRCDFVFFRPDGEYVRLHCGKSQNVPPKTRYDDDVVTVKKFEKIFRELQQQEPVNAHYSGL